jgi:4-alpha-glucanotransferase
MTSVANLCIVPVQDVLGLGSEARMNVPSQLDGNWSWRLHETSLTAELARKLAVLTELTDRDGCVLDPLKTSKQGDGKVPEDFAA